MKFKIKANDAKFDLVDEIVAKVQDMKKEDANQDTDECINNVLQDYFTDMDLVVEIFKWIAPYEDEIYNRVFDAAWEYIYGEVLEKFK